MFHLAEINIARILGETIDDPIMAGFTQNLSRINALAESMPGFVWRLKDDSDNATSIRVFDDPGILLNISVWESMEALYRYAYYSEHSDFYRRRHEWMKPLTDWPYMALWWIPAGTLPTPQEARARLEHLRDHGATPHAFNFKQRFSPEGVLIEERINIENPLPSRG